MIRRVRLSSPAPSGSARSGSARSGSAWSGSAWVARAATLPGQLLGLLLILLPAVAAPLPLTGAARAAGHALAGRAGFAGTVVVFGGLYHRLARRTPDGIDGDGADGADGIDDAAGREG